MSKLKITSFCYDKHFLRCFKPEYTHTDSTCNFYFMKGFSICNKFTSLFGFVRMNCNISKYFHRYTQFLRLQIARAIKINCVAVQGAVILKAFK